MSLLKSRVTRVETEIKRIQEAINLMKTDPDATFYSRHDTFDHGKFTGAVRRASMELTRALADMRKSSYNKLPGE